MIVTRAELPEVVATNLDVFALEEGGTFAAVDYEDEKVWWTRPSLEDLPAYMTEFGFRSEIRILTAAGRPAAPDWQQFAEQFSTLVEVGPLHGPVVRAD